MRISDLCLLQGLIAEYRAVLIRNDLENVEVHQAPAQLEEEIGTMGAALDIVTADIAFRIEQ